ncbi:LppX_LprAFG lipoprotein [Actinomadura welshii]
MIRRFATGVALAAGLVLSLSGCSGDSGGGKVDEAGEKGGTAELTAAQVLGKAAEKTGAVDSFQADLALEVRGSSQGDVSQKGTMKYRLKPEPAFSMSFDEISVGGRSMSGGEQRLVGQNMYVKLPVAQGGAQTSKPWVRVPLDGVGENPGVGLERLLQESREMDPLQNTRLLTASKDVKKAGEETVDGVETTRYTGTYRMEDAIAQLPAELQEAHRKSTGEAGVEDMSFDLWVDDQQLPRKLVTKADRSAGSMSMTITYRDYGEPVDVTEPPADQVTDMGAMQN